MPSEAGIERKCREYALLKGCTLYKMQGTGGWPDRMCICPGGLIFFVEMKKLGKPLAPLQAHTIKELRKLGFTAERCDTFEYFKELLDATLCTTAVEAAQLPNTRD